MNNLKKLCLLPVWLLVGALSLTAATLKHAPAENDPFKVAVWELDNGMEVMLSHNPNSSEVFLITAVKSGAIDDPADKSGLAHYLEHLLFKGSTELGTVDYPAEQPLLQQIEELYAKHSQTTDPAERNKLYQQIDQLSGQAAQYIIPNEYMQVMTMLGGSYTNAYTSQFSTCFLNSVPANELERLLKLEYNRFAKPVFRAFHTELETVYEEYNMYSDRPERVFQQNIMQKVFGSYAMGRPIAGTRTDLLNPEPAKVMAFYRQNYVPENMQIIAVGGFDNAKIIDQLEQTLGQLPPAGKLPERHYRTLPAYSSAETLELFMPLPPAVTLIWRLPDLSMAECDIADLSALALAHEQAGILTQKYLFSGKAVSVNASFSESPDGNNLFTIAIIPADNVSLAEAEVWANEALTALKQAELPDWFAEAAATQLAMELAKMSDSNESTAQLLAMLPYYRQSWGTQLTRMDFSRHITTKEIADFAQRYLTENHLTVKRSWGEFTADEKLPKPQLTPLNYPNANQHSKFFAELAAGQVRELEPFLLNVDRDVEKITVPEIDLNGYAVRNRRNNMFELTLIYNAGSDVWPELPYMAAYFNAVGTAELPAAEYNLELFRLGGSISLNAQSERTSLTISGPQERLPEILQLAKAKMTAPELNAGVWAGVADAAKLARQTARQKPAAILNALADYAKLGENSAVLRQLKTADLAKITPEAIAALPQKLMQTDAFLLACLPESITLTQLAGLPLNIGRTKVETPYFPHQDFSKPRVLAVDFPSTQTHILFLNSGAVYTPDNYAYRLWFNQYFGLGMGSTVFATLRESQALCYTAYAVYDTPSRPEDPHYYRFYIGTDAAKTTAALAAAKSLTMPVNVEKMNAVKALLLKNFRAERMTPVECLNTAFTYKIMNLPPDYREQNFAALQNMGATGLVKFYAENIHRKTPSLLLVGPLPPPEALAKYGEVEYLTVDDIMPTE